MESLHKMYDINLKKVIDRLVQAQVGGVPVVVLGTLSGDAGLRSSLSEVQIKDSFQRLITQGYLIKSPGRNKYQVAAVEDIENAPENNAQQASANIENKEIDSSSSKVTASKTKANGNGNDKKGLTVASSHAKNATPLKTKATPAGQVKCNLTTPSKAQVNNTPSKKSPPSGSGSGSKKASKSSGKAKKSVSKSTSKSPKVKASTAVQQNTLAWHIKKYSKTHFITFKNIRS